MANKFVNKIVQGKWWQKLLIAIVLVVLFLLFVNWLLKYITNHGETLPVPKVIGLTYDEAVRVLEDKELRCIAYDSVYVPKAKPNEIIDQNPSDSSLVKRNRMIYLTINALAVPRVNVPDVREMSLREATSELQRAGLRVGKITTRPDITTNFVLDQRYEGKYVKPGTELDKGTAIDLVVSKGEEEGDNEITMPDLVGLTADEAKTELSLLGLNIGVVTYDKSVTDKAFAVVYKQSRPANSKTYIGKEIDIFLKEVE